MAAEEKETKEKKEGKKSKGLLIIIIVMVLVILGGGGFAAYKLLLAPSKAKEQTASEEANPEDPLEVAPKKNAEAGVMYEIPSFVVNLADPSGTRYLRVAISLELPAANKQIAGPPAAPNP